jgi:glycine/serine hydroxymethyltransferase
MQALTGTLAEAGSESRRAGDQAGSALRALDERLAEGGQEIVDATEALAGETAALVQAAEMLRVRVSEGSDALQQKMSELLQRAQARIGEVIGRLGELQGAHEGVLAREVAHLESRRDELVEAVRQRLEERIAGPTAAAVDGVRGAFVAWGQDLQQCESRAQSAREAVAEGCEAVRGVTDPLRAAVDEVRAAAARVGLDFG